MTAPHEARELPLFPLQTVFFPGGRLALQIFEARYLDLMGRCLRDGSDFGIVNLVTGSEVRQPGEAAPSLAAVGVTAKIEQADMSRPGLMLVTLLGVRRFTLGAVTCRENGLWVTQATAWPDEPVLAPAPELAPRVTALRRILEQLAQRGMPSPPGVDSSANYADAGWVAHRWCELLPMEAPLRQALLEQRDPAARLAAVDRWLVEQGVSA